jgi:hypothetical protein
MQQCYAFRPRGKFRITEELQPLMQLLLCRQPTVQEICGNFKTLGSGGEGLVIEEVENLEAQLSR